MIQSFSYVDAAKLLGVYESKTMKALDKLLGGAILLGSPFAPSLIGLVDAKQEFVRLSNELINEFFSSRGKYKRIDRTDRMRAAVSICVVSSFFEALALSKLPLNYSELELTRSDQLKIAGSTRAVEPLPASAVASDILNTPVPSIEASGSLESLQGELLKLYSAMTERLLTFSSGLKSWEDLNEAQVHQYKDSIRRDLPDSSFRKFEELLSRLCAACGEMKCWVDIHIQRFTHAEMAQISVSLSRVQELLETSSDLPREELGWDLIADANRAILKRFLLDSHDTSSYITLPTVEVAYLDPAFQARTVLEDQSISLEKNWDGCEVQEDLASYLTGYLLSLKASTTPMVVLGQPGAGKSMLTQVLAARLPSEQFMAVRIELGRVPADADLQGQIEEGIYLETGRRFNWVDLARSAKGCIPVVFLDGFDELLQATGVDQSDYLLKVADFQRREAELGRPVTVLVTSRISVADRSRPPVGSTVLRLTPFDDRRITAWIEKWNATNSTAPKAEVKQLGVTAALERRNLCEQPLLLLMFALYVSGQADNPAELGQLEESELYSGLLRAFVAREVKKLTPGLTGSRLEDAIDRQMLQLSIVAFSMFNRGSQTATERDVDDDLVALGQRHERAGRQDFRADLTAGELAVGKFFFIHRATAVRSNREVAVYEFLHATFVEYLVAHLVSQVIREMAKTAVVNSSIFGAPQIDDSNLRPLLSFALLAGRRTVLGFFSEEWATSDMPADERRDTCEMLVKLAKNEFGRESEPVLAGTYSPRVTTRLRRSALYCANLITLAISTFEEPGISSLLEAEGMLAWQSVSAFLRSQLTFDEWNSLGDSVRVNRLPGSGAALESGTAAEFSLPLLNWLPDDAAATLPFSEFHVRRHVSLAASKEVDVLFHTLDPLLSRVPNYLTAVGSGSKTTALANLQELLISLSDVDGVDEGYRADLYSTVLAHAAVGVEYWNMTLPSLNESIARFAQAVFWLVANDPNAPMDTVLEFFGDLDFNEESAVPAAEMLLALLDRAAPEDEMALNTLLSRLSAIWSRFDMPAAVSVKAWCVLVELRLLPRTDWAWTTHSVTAVRGQQPYGESQLSDRLSRKLQRSVELYNLREQGG